MSLPADDQPDGGHEEEEEEQQEEERLDDLTRKLILREEELFTQDCRSEEEEDRLLKDFESLSVRVWMAVHSSFDATAPPAGRPDVLRSAVDAVLQQETQDRRWTESPTDSAPVWRPLRWLRTHNQLLQKMVEKRLKDAGEDETGDTGQLSSVTKRQVMMDGWMDEQLSADVSLISASSQSESRCELIFAHQRSLPINRTTSSASFCSLFLHVFSFYL